MSSKTLSAMKRQISKGDKSSQCLKSILIEAENVHKKSNSAQFFGKPSKRI